MSEENRDRTFGITLIVIILIIGLICMQNNKENGLCSRSAFWTIKESVDRTGGFWKIYTRNESHS